MGRYEFKQEDLIGLVGYLHAETRTKGDEVQFKECPYCHASDKWTFSVNMVNGCFNCLRATCGVKGAFVELCRDMDYELSIGEENAFKALKQPPTGHLLVSRVSVGCRLACRYD